MSMYGVDKVIVEGKGVILKDIDGKEYIDMISGTMTAATVGYSHPKVVEAVKKQAEKLMHVTPWTTTPVRVELAEKIAKIAPGRMRDNCKTAFSSGGSEANEFAVKFAMSVQKRGELICLYQSYHGATIATANMGGFAGVKAPAGYPLPKIGGFHHIPPAYCYRCFWGQSYPGCDFECAQALDTAIKHAPATNNVAAFMLETIQGPAGHIPYPPEYYKLVREICDKYGILVIADEVQLALGRTGKPWASETMGLEPDIFTSGKAIGGGMPLSTTSIRADLVSDELTTAGWQLLTHGGTPITCAAGSAAIDVMIEEKLPEKAVRQGARITRRLKEMQEKHRIIGDVRGPGLYIGVELVKDRKTKERALEEAKKIAAKLFEKGIIIGLNLIAAPAGMNVIKIKPPLAISDEHVDIFLDRLEETIKEVER